MFLNLFKIALELERILWKSFWYVEKFQRILEIPTESKMIFGNTLRKLEELRNDSLKVLNHL